MKKHWLLNTPLQSLHTPLSLPTSQCVTFFSANINIDNLTVSFTLRKPLLFYLTMPLTWLRTQNKTLRLSSFVRFCLVLHVSLLFWSLKWRILSHHINGSRYNTQFTQLRKYTILIVQYTPSTLTHQGIFVKDSSKPRVKEDCTTFWKSCRSKIWGAASLWIQLQLWIWHNIEMALKM